MSKAQQLKEKKIVNLLELKVLLNPRLQIIQEALNKCKDKNCAICKEIKEATGIITKL